MRVRKAFVSHKARALVVPHARGSIASLMSHTPRILGISILTVAVVAIGAFVTERQRLRNLENTMEETAAAIIAEYTELAESHLFPLEEGTLTTDQRAIMADVRADIAFFPNIPVLSDRVYRIQEMQRHMTAFVERATNARLRKNEHFLALEQGMGEDGEVRASLDTYNNAAKDWNVRMERRISQLTANLSGEDIRTLPYLRFDGLNEEVQIIEI
jgi:hypothetical protein